MYLVRTVMIGRKEAVQRLKQQLVLVGSCSCGDVWFDDSGKRCLFPGRNMGGIINKQIIDIFNAQSSMVVI